jgi:hypothetical protein
MAPEVVDGDRHAQIAYAFQHLPGPGPVGERRLRHLDPEAVCREPGTVQAGSQPGGELAIGTPSRPWTNSAP